MGTSAAPFYLPPHHFEVNSSKGTKRFNLIDGGIAAKNPTLLAICEAAKEMSGNGNSPSLSMVDSSKLLVLSLGTGASKRDVELEVADGRELGLFNWFMGPTNTAPFFDVLFTAMDDILNSLKYARLLSSMVLKTTIFESRFAKRLSEERRFRQQHSQTNLYSLKYIEASTDNSKKENLENLEKIGIALLKKPVSAVNLESGLYEPLEDSGTYEEALVKFAERLSEERRFLLANSSA
ncbi:patatin-like protein 3 [Pistacia vera]|uniref:patatin-like protein 3 n=1 Tax=Pistacia vera TaxID=55513 RepID=UPI001262DF6E|nr:patatin-like protein 3 [Pistacia vera]